MAKKKIPKEVLIAAISGLVIIEVVALLKGINGTLMMMITAAIAGIAGWSVPQLKTN